MKIYVASSWRNDTQPALVQYLTEQGHEVYDFKNPAPGNNGFGWRELDPNWQNWNNNQYIAALEHPIAESGYASDFNAMQWADACVLVLPCGRSAHTEAGWMQGQGKPTIVLLDPNGQEPELMYKIYYSIETTFTGVKNSLESITDIQNLTKQFLIFKVGDWVYYEFKLGKVCSLNTWGEVNGIDFGYNETFGALNPSTFPLNMDNKLVSAEFATWYDKLRREAPDLDMRMVHPYLVHLWEGLVSDYSEDNFKTVIQVLDDFGHACIDAQHEKDLCMGTEPRRINGIRIFNGFRQKTG